MFSPVPPAPTGIADYLADLMPLLPQDWQLELFVDGQETGGQWQGAPVRPHQQWKERHRAAPFDLNIYQVGNNAAHSYMHPYVTEHPGLLVLHDAILHPSRVAAHVGAADVRGYRAVAEASEGAAGSTLAQLVASGLGSPELYWRFPLSGDLVAASLLTVVHGELLARWLRALQPHAEIGCVAHWRAVPPVEASAVAGWRSRLGADDECPLIGSFGHFGKSHRIDLVLEALAALAPTHSFQAVMVGTVDPTLRLPERAVDLGLQERICWTGAVSNDEFAALLHAVDLGLNLRYPTARSSSGTLQQLMQLGVPTAITDLVHLRDLPDAAVLRVAPGQRRAEIEGLREGLSCWLADPERRGAAGAAAAEWAGREITAAAMAGSYRKAVDRALARRRAR